MQVLVFLVAVLVAVEIVSILVCLVSHVFHRGFDAARANRLRRRRMPDGRPMTPSAPSLPSRRSLLARRLDTHLNLFASAFAVLAGSTLIAMAVVIERVDEGWYRLPPTLHEEAFFKPAAVLLGLLAVGISGLLLCLLFILLPRSWGFGRDWQAIAVWLCAVVMAIAPLIAVSQMLEAARLTTQPPEAPPAAGP